VLKSSRGRLVSDYLLAPPSEPLQHYVDSILAHDDKYAGFNLLLFAPSRSSSGALSFNTAKVTNHGAGGIMTARDLTQDESAHGAMSNGIDGQGADQWPKVRHGKETLKTLLDNRSASNNSEETLLEDLFELLSWRCPDPIQDRSQLRNTIEVDPLPIRPEQSSSAEVTPADFYGTRISTVILIRRDGRALFIERDIWQMQMDGEHKITRAAKGSQRVQRFNLSL